MADPEDDSTEGADPGAEDGAAATGAVEPVDEPRVAKVKLPELVARAGTEGPAHLSLLMDVGVELSAVVGRRELTLEQILGIQAGTVIDLERGAGEPVELMVNGRPIARAEIVVVKNRLGARVVSMEADPAALAAEPMAEPKPTA